MPSECEPVLIAKYIYEPAVAGFWVPVWAPDCSGAMPLSDVDNLSEFQSQGFGIDSKGIERELIEA